MPKTPGGFWAAGPHNTDIWVPPQRPIALGAGAALVQSARNVAYSPSRPAQRPWPHSGRPQPCHSPWRSVRLLAETGGAVTLKSRTSRGLLHCGQRTSSVVRTSSSCCPPHAWHWYSYNGIAGNSLYLFGRPCFPCPESIDGRCTCAILIAPRVPTKPSKTVERPHKLRRLLCRGRA